MLTCWYNPKKTYNDLEIIPDYEINMLTDLKNIL